MKSRSHYTSNTGEHLTFAAILILAASLYSVSGNIPIKVINNFILSVLLIVFISSLVVSSMVYLLMVFRKRISKKHNILKLIDTMSGLQFEQYIGKLLPKLGFKYVLYTERYDLGIDIIAQKNDEAWGIQIKRQNTPVGIRAVQQVVSALKFYECNKSLVITNSTFSKPAQKLAKSNDCMLLGKKELIKYL